jgi:hypothetical protein
MTPDPWPVSTTAIADAAVHLLGERGLQVAQVGQRGRVGRGTRDLGFRA